MAAVAPAPNRWLHGPAPDLLFGCGGLYTLVFATLLLSAGSWLREAQPAVVLPLVALFAGSPHYGATLLRVYENRRDRRGYVLFSLWATLAVAAAFVAGLWVHSVAVFLLTLYLSWTPWHYTGQNYGVSVMFLRRNGVELGVADKRWLYASFVSSFLLVLVVMHAGAGSLDFLTGYTRPGVLRFQPIGIPAAFAGVAVPLLAAGSALSLAVAGWRLTRRAPLRALAPSALLAVTQALWFSLPFLLRHLDVHPVRAEALDWDFRTYYFLWIAAGHHLQYLWVTSYYARQSGRWSGYPSWYAKVLAAGAAAWTLPALVFGPLGVGPLSMDMGLALLVASAVNLHHFILDGAIWKLRGRIAEVLIRSRSDRAEDERPSPFGAALRRTVWAACAAGLFVYAFQVVHEESVRRGIQRGAVEEVRAAWNRLGWLGLDGAQGRLDLGADLLARGDVLAARAEFQRSLDLAPLPGAWDGLAKTHAHLGEWRRAAEVCEQGLRAAPEHVGLLAHGALAWRQAGEPDRALPLIERAASLAPDNAAIRTELRRVRAALSRSRTASAP